MKLLRLFDLLEYGIKHFTNNVVINYQVDGNVKNITFNNLIESSNKISHFLIENGVKKGNITISFTANCPEFNYFDFAVTQIGAIHVSLSPFAKDEEIDYVLNETEAVAIFISHKLLFQKIKSTIEKSKNLKIILLGEDFKGYEYIQNILTSSLSSENLIQLDKRKDDILSEDLATIIYTSGSTGHFKGAMFTHSNIVNYLMAVIPYLGYKENFKIISYLPVSHTFERIFQYISIYCGMTICYKDNNTSLLRNVQRIKPDVMIATPVILENFQKEYIACINLKSLIKNKRKEFKTFLGGKLKKIVSGSAFLSFELEQFYWDMGIPIYNGYGSTETIGAIAINSEFEHKFGTVGKPFFQYETELSDEGELRIRGSNVMKGYFKNPELTKIVLDENGWYSTGDIVSLDEDGFLKIIGRKSENYKLNVGNFVNPSSIEDKLKTNPLVKHIVVVGDNQSFLSALIVPNIENLSKWAIENKILFSKIEDLLKNDLILNKYSNIIDLYNEHCFDYETIKRFILLRYDFSVEGGELNSLLRIRRKVIMKKYSKIISSFYEK